MLRWFKRGSLALLVVLGLALLAAIGALRGSLPALEGERPLTGLLEAATVTRDANGTVTIDAASEADAMRALGYVHAQERYFEMDLLRRTAAGELAALFGPIAVDTDKAHRLHRMRARAAGDLDAIAGDKRHVPDAYVAGVNAGVAALRARPWPYLLLRQQPRPWQAADTPLVAFAMYFDLQGGRNASELARMRMQPHLPPALFALLMHEGSRWDAPLQGAARGDAVLPAVREVDLRSLPAPTAPAPGQVESKGTPGSNNFAVAGTLTADGRAIVADDMHLGLRAPNIWFRARLRYPDARAPGNRVDVQGVSLPGLPGIIVGSNGHVAWGFTNSMGDYMDSRREWPCTNRSTAGCARVVVHRERIDVAGAKSVELDVEQTQWGPVTSREADGSVLSLRWTAHLPGAVNLGVTHLAVARDVEQALALADGMALPTQNLVIGDARGRIAWRLLGPLPQRGPGCNKPGAVQDATQASACPPWSASTAASVTLGSPAIDRLWTANNRVVDGDALLQLGDGGYALGARALQIRAGLYARQRFNERDLLAIQLDDRALFLQPWWLLLRERAQVAGTPALTALAAAARRWEGRASSQSTSYRIVRAWRMAVNDRIKEGLLAPAQVALGKEFVMPELSQLEGVSWPLVTQRPAHLLPRHHASWDALFEDAANTVQHDLIKAGPLQERTWGERNTAAICHPLASAVPLIGKRLLCMPAEPLPGDTAMPRVQGPGFGASQRMVVAPGHERDGILHMPGGQSGHPLSPFWGAGHDDWVHGRPSPFLPGPARYTLRLAPAR
ncbi:MAG: penicillin acylase family protein [Pseudomonadota bacterium]